MGYRSRDWREWALIASLLALLQYRWTGELSRAETQRLFTSAGARLQQFTRAFDTGLRQTITDFIPSGEEIALLGPKRANEERLKNIGSHLERPIFRRIAAAVPVKAGKLQFLEANLAGQTFVASPWPDSSDWQGLRTRLERLARGETPPAFIADPNTSLIEVPVFGEGAEQEWILFELDTDYAAKTWLPETAFPPAMRKGVPVSKCRFSLFASSAGVGEIRIGVGW